MANPIVTEPATPQVTEKPVIMHAFAHGKDSMLVIKTRTEQGDDYALQTVCPEGNVATTPVEANLGADASALFQSGKDMLFVPKNGAPMLKNDDGITHLQHLSQGVVEILAAKTGNVIAKSALTLN